MKTLTTYPASIPGTLANLLAFIAAAVLAGCASPDPAQKASIERGPHGTVGYKVQIDSNEPGVRVEANNQFVGTTPFVLTIFGDRDGTFHKFDGPDYIIRAVPVKPGQNLQTKFFHTGDDFTSDDKIPKRIYFDMIDPENTRIEGVQTPIR